jgi:16S rRNA pseudouridine516 synthase
MMRLDKYLAAIGTGSRSQVKAILKKGEVKINGTVERQPEYKITEADEIFFRGKQLVYSKLEYYMLNKPAGCVCAAADPLHQTVFSYLTGIKRKDLFSVGRLDLDTEGLLIITNDGALCHNLLSPTRHVDKVYYVKIAGCLTMAEQALLTTGLNIGEKKCTKPAVLQILSSGAESEVLLTITEGKFHQVKRMFEAVNKKVTYLKRIAMGSLSLDRTLAPGAYRPLTERELQLLQLDGDNTQRHNKND